MKRKAFFRNLLGLVGVAASTKELASLIPRPKPNEWSWIIPGGTECPYIVGCDPYDKPGLDGVVFTMIIKKEWFNGNKDVYAYEYIKKDTK